MSTIVPAILEQTPEAFADAARTLASFSPMIHVDLADGRFVPNRTLSLAELKTVQPNVPFRVHLMYEKPEQVLTELTTLNADCIIIHAEATNNLRAVLEAIQDSGKQAGVALNPETSIKSIAEIVPDLHFILFLSVKPGFQGSAFVPDVLEKIRLFRAQFPEKAIGIDGAMNCETVPRVRQLGVTNIVVGSAILKHESPKDAYQELQRLAS